MLFSSNYFSYGDFSFFSVAEMIALKKTGIRMFSDILEIQIVGLSYSLIGMVRSLLSKHVLNCVSC